MRMSTGVGLAAIGIMAISLPAIMVGCGAAGAVAATVNGENIEESSITTYIENFRNVNSLNDDTAWAQWLVDNGRTAEELRQDAIDYYVRIAVIAQDAKSKGIEVTKDDIDAQIDEIKSYYGYDDAQFKEQIEAIGYTEESYREYIKQQLTQERLMAATEEQATASDEEILSMANNYSSILNGAKKVKTIVISKDESANAADVRAAAVAAGADCDAIAAENTATTDYDGWDVLVPMDSAVAEAIATMDKGAITDVIVGTDWLFIVKVEDACVVGDEGFTSLDQVPAELQAEFRTNVESSAKSTAFESYVQNLIDSADVKVNEMPKKLSYDVSTEGIEPTTATNVNDANEITLVDENGNPINDGSIQVTTSDEASSEGAQNSEG